MKRLLIALLLSTLLILPVLPVAAFQSLKLTVETLAEMQGVSGYENQVSAYIAERLERNRPAGSNLEVTVDNLQNVIVRVGLGAPNRLIVTPIDEPGYFVSGVTEEGYLRVQRLPQFGVHPWFDLLHANQPVTIGGRRGANSSGVFAGLSTHLQGGRVNPEDNVVDHLDEVYIDVGARSPAAARMAGGDILAPLTLEKEYFGLANNQMTAPFISSRAGAAVLINLLETLDANRMQGTLTVAFVTRRYAGNVGLSRLMQSHSAEEILFVQPWLVDTSPLGSGVQVGAFGEDTSLRDELLALSDKARATINQAVPRARYYGPVELPARSVSLIFPVKFPITPAEVVSGKDLRAVGELLAAHLGFKLPGDKPEPAPEREAPFTPSGKPLMGDLLHALVETYGVSGHEEAVAAKVQELMPEWARKWATVDSKGNVIVTFGPESNKPELLFVAHTDEIGWDFLGHSVLIHTANGQIPAVIELPENYLTEKFVPVRGGRGYSAYTGATNAAEVAELGIEIGDPITVPKKFRTLSGKRVSGRSCDDRCGSAALLAALWEINPEEINRQVTFVWAVEEELGLNGAKHVAARLAERNAIPDYVFAVDTFVSSDSPLESKRFAYGQLGKGFVVRAIDSSNIVPREYVDKVVQLARQNRIPVQYGTMNGGNDGAAFVRYGSVDIPIAWPLRYSHSAGEVLDMGDLEALSNIVVVLVKSF
jgi:putative aminopeptidase FrvX